MMVASTAFVHGVQRFVSDFYDLAPTLASRMNLFYANDKVEISEACMDF